MDKKQPPKVDKKLLEKSVKDKKKAIENDKIVTKDGKSGNS